MARADFVHTSLSILHLTAVARSVHRFVDSFVDHPAHRPSYDGLRKGRECESLIYLLFPCVRTVLYNGIESTPPPSGNTSHLPFLTEFSFILHIFYSVTFQFSFIFPLSAFLSLFSYFSIYTIMAMGVGTTNVGRMLHMYNSNHEYML
jgi:hypothetical protein